MSKKEEKITLSVHSIFREKKLENNKNELIPFTEEEFKNLYASLEQNKNELDISDSRFEDDLRHRRIGKINNIEIINNSIFGIYETSYWGHEYKNARLGKISANELNYKPFFFFIYLSENGKLYIGNQYLGNFGSYSAIEKTIISNINKKGCDLVITSFNDLNESFKDLKMRKIEIGVHTAGKKAEDRNSYKDKCTIVLGRNKDEKFQSTVIDLLLNRENERTIRKKVSEISKNAELFEIRESDIETVKIFTNKGMIYLLGENGCATRFELDVEKDSNGHPNYIKIKEQAIRILKNKILNRCGNV